jgi:hypothetical protein
MKLFYVAIFLVVASMPVGFIGMFAAWDRTPPNLRLFQLDQIVHTGGMVYLGMIGASVLLFIVWLSLPGDHVQRRIVRDYDKF